jgi:hypothetical protein
VYKTRPPLSNSTLPYLEEPVLTEGASLAAVARGPLLERAVGAAASSVDELDGGVMFVGLADAMMLDAVLPQAANAAAEPSASTIVGIAMVRDTRLISQLDCGRTVMPDRRVGGASPRVPPSTRGRSRAAGAGWVARTNSSAGSS